MADLPGLSGSNEERAVDYCGLCGEDFGTDDERVELMDSNEITFWAHKRCAS